LGKVRGMGGFDGGGNEEKWDIRMENCRDIVHHAVKGRDEAGGNLRGICRIGVPQEAHLIAACF